MDDNSARQGGHGVSSSEATALWGAVSEVLRQRIPSQDFYSWFAMAEPVLVDSERLTLSFANAFAVDWVRDRFASAVADSVRQVSGRELQIEFVSRETPPGALPGPAPIDSLVAAVTAAPFLTIPGPPLPPVASHDQALAFRPSGETLTEDELRAAVGGPRGPSGAASVTSGPAAAAPAANHGQPLNGRYRFDTFVIGEGNQLAHAAALSVAEAPGQSYNPLFIYGGTGLGKTHLLHAIGHYAMETRPGTTVAYVTTEQFLTQFFAVIQRRDSSKERFKQYFRGVDVLLMDDVQFVGGKGNSLQEELFHTFNALHESGKQVVLTSDTEPGSIPQLEERLRSRFAWGLMTDIATPDHATRMAILRKRAQAEGLDVPADVLAAVADRITTNVRELEGALTRIVGYASLTGRPVRLDLAASVLESYAPARQQAVTIDRIQNVICEYFALTRADLVGARKTADIVQPRQIAMYLARVLLGAPSTQVGKRFGRDHSTVLHAEKKIDQLIKQDREVYDLVERLTHTIRQGNDRVSH